MAKDRVRSKAMIKLLGKKILYYICRYLFSFFSDFYCWLYNSLSNKFGIWIDESDDVNMLKEDLEDS